MKPSMDTSNGDGVFNDKPVSSPPPSAFSFFSKDGSNKQNSEELQNIKTHETNPITWEDSNRTATPRSVDSMEGGEGGGDDAHQYGYEKDRDNNAIFANRRFRNLVIVISVILAFVIGVSVGVTTGSKGEEVAPTRNTGPWLQVFDSITQPDSLHERLGLSLSLSNDGKRVAVTASGVDNHNEGGVVLGGWVRIYEQNETKWDMMDSNIFLTEYEGTGTAPVGQQKALACAMSGNGNVVLVLSSRFGGVGGDIAVRQAGYAQVFHNQHHVIFGWRQLGDTLLTPDFVPTSLAISETGRIIALGSVLNNKVQAYTFNSTTEEWNEMGQMMNGESSSDGFGSSISLSDDGLTLAVGAPRADNTNAVGTGRVVVFTLVDNVWREKGQPLHGKAANDHAATVKLSGDGSIAAVGAGRNQNAAGHVRVYQFTRDPDVWTQIGQDLEGEEEGDYSGSRLDLSQNGMVVAVGASSNSNGRGHVRIYRYNQKHKQWRQEGPDLDGRDDNDAFGTDVSISSDGTIVAIGATQDGAGRTTTGEKTTDDNKKRGYVDVYKLK